MNRIPEPLTHPPCEPLHFLRMTGVFYCRSELTAPWGIALPAMGDCMMLHMVTSGECQLVVDGVPTCHLKEGDLALVPHGAGHLLLDDPETEPVPLFDLDRELISERYEILRCGGGGNGTGLMCAVVRFEHPAAFHLLDLLPRVIRVEVGTGSDDLFPGMMKMMAAEARTMRPGGETVITRLADILVIHVIRTWMTQDAAAQTGWLAALRDEKIGRAITMIHREPAKEWSVASLAHEVAMSRSAFAARFTELVGEPAMRYVTRWRMHLALLRLRETDDPLWETAEQLGYRSEAAFSRAFKRFFGISPGAARKREQGAILSYQGASATAGSALVNLEGVRTNAVSG